MLDIQMEQDNRNIALKNVGINKLKWPICVKGSNGKNQYTSANISMSVSLKHNVRGTHMSRFIEVINEVDHLDFDNIEIMLDRLNERLDSKRSQCRFEFDYFIEKLSPVTSLVSRYDVKCCIEAIKDEKFNLIMSIAIPVITLCPCSKEISDFGAHNQRAITTIKVDINKKVWIEELVKIAEESASSPIFSLLKRKDEKWVTEKSYLNPRFVEDVAREVSLKLEKDDRINWYSVLIESIESIHNHNAFAYTEKDFVI